jgi:hypothetical protein
MSTGSQELVTTDESAVIAESVLDAIVVEEGESDGGFSDSPCANKGDGFEVFGETDELLDQLVTSKTCPGWWGR